MEEYNNWLIEEQSGIFWAKLNRADKMNAFNQEVAEELNKIIMYVKNTPSIKVFVIGTASDDYFSAGADVDWFMKINGPEAVDVSYQVHQVFGNLERLSIPVIAAVKGLCLTAGLELIMCSDMIYAAENAKFGQIECRFGITPGGGGTQRLTRLVGPLKAKELIYLGRIISSQEAAKIGLVNAVFELEDFDTKINKICRKIILNSSEAIRECKFMIQQATYINDTGFQREEIVFGKRFASGEPNERLSFMKAQQKREKRKEERLKKKKQEN
ncbi:enoyl-CoA hydratase/isomerase family protein [Promethearchaeum syntrophicum]|uniref:Enoyl-CoA hydratase/isomerase family protein n=1 Tax=Promethearchaeum syntrophicum TaxID=2594042 RepID=A0A5B9D9Q6_9ARCH|nr:enoyl-CoA hydratase/isomerase family protein [Candidatus Prometheoarchaeum syntrophicum]QEE15470.1 3-hydroxypropionyl-coenzyme A dehydratase [Candidatus Prometheoarchaeum syntrophicum]